MNSCVNCKKETSNAKFCSRSCSVSYNNNIGHWRAKHGILKGENSCLHCGEKTNNNKYCSAKCQHRHQTTLILESGKASPKTMKRLLLEETGNKCWTCGIQDWNGKPIIMELEHNDGNSQNNNRENLSLICPNCHSQTSTYKNRNKGNGRHSRRVRYAEGKSY